MNESNADSEPDFVHPQNDRDGTELAGVDIKVNEDKNKPMIDFNTFEEVDVQQNQQEKSADEQPEEDTAAQVQQQASPAAVKKEDEESSGEEEKEDSIDEQQKAADNDNDEEEEANSSQRSDPVTPPSPLSKDEDSDDAEAGDKHDAKSKDSGDLQEFFGNILKQRNLDTEADESGAKNKQENAPTNTTNNDPMGIMMSNSIMQSTVVGNENFEEDDDELDIFAESNKNEPMRNPILGGSNNNSSMNYSVMDNSQMNASVSTSQQQPQSSNNIRGHVANIIDNNLSMHQSASQEDSSAYIDKIIEIQVYIK